MTAQIIPLPRYHGPKKPAKRGRPPKNQHRAEVHYLWQRREAINADRQDPKREAYRLYTEASKIDETDIKAAIPMYLRAIDLDPTLALAWTNLGNCYFRDRTRPIDDRHAQAEHCYHRAMQVNPSQPEAHYNSGVVALENGHLNKAISLLSQALQLEPDYPDAHYNLAIALEQRAAERGYPYTSHPLYLDNQLAQRHWRHYAQKAPCEGASHWLETAKARIQANELDSHPNQPLGSNPPANQASCQPETVGK